MNTSTAHTALRTNTQSRLSALALAGVMTLTTLLGLSGLASSEATPAQLAHHQKPQVQQPV